MAKRKRPDVPVDLEPTFDLPGLHIYDYEEELQSNGVKLIRLFTEPAKRSARRCPYCDSRNVYSNGFYHRELLDLPMFRQDVVIDFEYQQYRCKNCGRLYQDEITEIAGNKMQMTHRLREAIARDSLKYSFQTSAIINNVSNATAKYVFDEWSETQDEKRPALEAPRVLGIDEAHLGSGKKDMRGVFIDVEKGLLLDITSDRESETIADFILSLKDVENVKIVTMDMARSYRSVVYDVLGPKTVIVVDHFHVVQDLMKKVIKSRKLVVQKAGKPKLGNNADLMRVNLESLKDFQKEQLMDQFAIVPELAILYALKESFRSIYTCKTRTEAEDAYKRWCDMIPPRDPVSSSTQTDKKARQKKYEDRFDPIRVFKNTVDQWHKEIFNWFDHTYTNAATEAINGLIKITNRNGRGYAFEVLRHKLIYGLQADLIPTETVYIHKGDAANKNTATAYAYSDISADALQNFVRITRPRSLTYEECLPNIEGLLRAIETGQIYIGPEDLVDEEEE